MRVLILNTTPISKMFKNMNLSGSYAGGGWVEEVIEYLNKDNEVIFCCFWIIPSYIDAIIDNVKYCVIPTAFPDFNRTNRRMIDYLKKVYEDNNPDIVQIFGTEHEWTTQALRVIPREKIVIHITGLVSVIANHYYANMDMRDILMKSFRDILKGGIIEQRNKFIKYGKNEIESIKLAQNVMGRTTWDKACVTQINPYLRYFHCDEMLRSAFYNYEWSLDKCEKHSIFVSSGNYPIKGLHMLIKAIAIVRQTYPDVKLYIAGNNIIKNQSLKDRLSRTTYGKYIQKLIKKHRVQNCVFFIGSLDANDMVENYLRANVYVLPSAIENSPNSLGEAMLLGVPCVASCVGGVQDMLIDKKEGFLYPFDEYYMLAYYIMVLFENDELAVNIGKNARIHAVRTHNREKIFCDLTQIYKNIMMDNS